MSWKPASGEIAEEVGMISAVLGKLLTKHGIPRPKNMTRGAGAERLREKFYTVEQIPEVAEAVEMESRPQGWLMSVAGFRAINGTREGKKACRYAFEMREKIEEMLEGM